MSQNEKIVEIKIEVYETCWNMKLSISKLVENSSIYRYGYTENTCYLLSLSSIQTVQVNITKVFILTTLPRYVWSCDSVTVCVTVTLQEENSYILPWYGHLLKYCVKMFKNEEVDLLWGWMLPKIRIISKNASSKSCRALNSVQKSHLAHMSLSPKSGGRGSKYCYHLKYYNVQKQGSRFTLRLDAQLFWSLFWYNAYFWQRPAAKRIYFPIFEHYCISKDGNLWSPYSTLGRR